MILQATAAGALSGAIMLFFSHVAPQFGAGNFIRDMDEPRILGKELSRREAHVIGALSHLLVAAISASIYAYLVTSGVAPGYHFLPILGWSVVAGLFIGGVIMPLEGHGVFGVKEDAWFPVDLFLTQAIWAVLFWWIINLWPNV